MNCCIYLYLMVNFAIVCVYTQSGEAAFYGRRRHGRGFYKFFQWIFEKTPIWAWVLIAFGIIAGIGTWCYLKYGNNEEEQLNNVDVEREFTEMPETL